MDYRDALAVSRGRPPVCKDTAVRGVVRPPLCPQLPGTVLRIFIPPGAEINLLNIIELSSPGGICIIIRLPFLKKFLGCSGGDLAGLFDSVKLAGGSIDVLD